LLLAIFILALAIVEAYAHTYVKGLETVSENEARHYMMRFTEGPYSTSYYNTSQIFSRSVGGAKVNWLITLMGQNPNRSETAYFHIFKVDKTGGVLVQDLEIVPMGADLEVTSQYRTEGSGHQREVTYNIPPNFTVVFLDYDMNLLPRTYYFQFSLTLKVYANTLLGYIPIEEAKLPMNVTVQL